MGLFFSFWLGRLNASTSGPAERSQAGLGGERFAVAQE
jgi:hypothetical protein